MIKIDKAFVDGIGENIKQDRLVQENHRAGARTGSGHGGGGHRAAEQAAVLRTMNSGFGQGFHFARPLPSSEIDTLVAPAPIPFPASAPRVPETD
jgi:EAL domain-containing protein (putative c-di-GMP-specific phosphodiesterase class I)